MDDFFAPAIEGSDEEMAVIPAGELKSLRDEVERLRDELADLRGDGFPEE